MKNMLDTQTPQETIHQLTNSEEAEKTNEEFARVMREARWDLGGRAIGNMPTSKIDKEDPHPNHVDSLTEAELYRQIEGKNRR